MQGRTSTGEGQPEIARRLGDTRSSVTTYADKEINSPEPAVPFGLVWAAIVDAYRVRAHF